MDNEELRDVLKQLKENEEEETHLQEINSGKGSNFEKVDTGGMFSDWRKSSANSVYENTKRFLKKKDGNIHIVMINSFSQLGNQVFHCEAKYTSQLEQIITDMQNDGYEIVDIKFNSIQNQGLTGQAEGLHTLILYK